MTGKPSSTQCSWLAPQTLFAGAALASLLFAAFPVIGSLVSAWHSEEYSHGFIIPIIAIFIGWHRLAEKKPVIDSSWWGLTVLLIAAALLLVGRLSAFEPPAFYGLLLALVGLSLAAFGINVTRVLAPAFIYLLFAIPLPRLIYVGLSQSLQLLSSSLGVLPLDLAGVPVFQDGNIIDLGGYKLQVVEACSGLRYLFPLMSFGYLVAYLLDDRLWKRAVLFLSAIPITIGMNALRIAFIGVTVDLWGGKAAGGFLHDFEGWTVFLLCIAVLMGEVWILLRIGKRGQFRYDYLGFAHGKLFSGYVGRTAPVGASLVLCACLAVLLGTGLIDERAEITPAHPPFALFPLTPGVWHGRTVNMEPDVLHELQLSDYWLADYWQGDDKQPVNFYVAYYASQRVGSSAHSPSNCLPGSGWRIAKSAVKTIALPDNAYVTVSRLLIRNGDRAELVYYWFDERGRDLTEQYGAKWHLLWDSITMHRTDGALIRLTTQLGDGEDEIVAEKRLNDFLAVIHPAIKAFVPGATITNNIAAP